MIISGCNRGERHRRRWWLARPRMPPRLEALRHGNVGDIANPDAAAHLCKRVVRGARVFEVELSGLEVRPLTKLLG
jgi:hypothetical protein